MNCNIDNIYRICISEDEALLRIHGLNSDSIIMQNDANRCSLDVINNKTEEKLLRSKDNLAGTKIDHR